MDLVKRGLLLASFWLAGTSSAWGAGWNCSVTDELDENRTAMMETLVGVEDDPATLDFYLYRVPQRGYIASQSMTWIGIPRAAASLWKPDRIEFGIPGRETDEDGFIRFDSLQQVSLYSVVRPASVRSLRPTFDLSWVKIEDASVIAQLWHRPARRVSYIGRGGRSLGETEILLPAPADAQTLFTRMRAALERKLADPAAHCRALPDPTPEELMEMVI